ncbi:hypothetical protein LIER_41448 [Lithospermum erythrorhizon]|uniref:Uncharacterized protein n=1 Tax=Lithospermum erythrorhizon TaxID=34254 RepID=A0AAV3R9G5_LITER
MQPVPRQPVTEISPVVSAILFAMWGINLVGQFLKPPVKYKDAVVAVDYFNRWVEAAPLRSTTSEAIELVYGTEAVLPIEVCLPNIRQVEFNEKKNDDRMRGLLDFADELRDQALSRLHEQKRKMFRFYNHKVRGRTLPGPEGYKPRKEIDHTWNGVYLKKYYV